MGLSTRSHSNTKGNVVYLLEEKFQDVLFLKSWMQQRNNWLNSNIQNEILEIISLTIQCELIKLYNRNQYLLQFFSTWWYVGVKRLARFF